MNETAKDIVTRNSPEERKLIEACQTGDQTAFEQLYRNYSRDVFSLAYRLTGSSQDAEEITQEVFVSVYRNLGRFQFQSAFSTWLYRIVVRRAADAFRKIKKVWARRVPLETDEPGGPIAYLSDDRETPRDAMQESSREQQIERAIAELGEKHRAIIILRYIHDMSYEEIADILECRLGTVKSRLNRAHRLLHKALMDLGFNEKEE